MVQLKVVLDTSVLISALKTKNPSRSPSIRVLELLKTSTLQNYGSNETLREMRETLAIIGFLVGKPEKAKAVYNLVQNHPGRISPRVKFEEDPKIVEAVGHLDDVSLCIQGSLPHKYEHKALGEFEE